SAVRKQRLKFAVAAPPQASPPKRNSMCLIATAQMRCPLGVFFLEGIAMLRLVLATVLLAFGFTNAMAADLPVKAPPIVAAEYNWTGIYGGINAGWIRDTYHWQYTNPAPATCCAPFSASQDNFLIGGHIGAQYQFNHFVLGVEAAVF